MEQRSAWQRAQLWGGLAFGVGALLWFLGSLQWDQLGSALLAIEAPWLLASLLAMMLHYAFHAWRWGVFLKPIDGGIGARLLWSSTAVLWGFNTVMPLRAGNLLRPLVISRARRLPYPTVLFATIAEYVLDSFAILGLVLWLIWVVPPELAPGPLGDGLQVARGLAAGAVTGLIVVIALSNGSVNTGINALLHRIPARRTRVWAVRFFRQVVTGLGSLHNPWRLLEASVLTVALWGSWLLSAWCALQAFRLDLPPQAALSLEAALSVAMMVPQAPGFLGVFQVVTEEVLTRWRAPAGTAQAMALVFWCVCFVPITIVGLVEGARHGLREETPSRS